MATVASTIARAGHQVDVEMPNETVDAVGARVANSFQIIKRDIPCWVQPASADTREDYGARMIQITHTIYFFTDPEVLEGYRIIFGDRKFVVLGVRDEAELNRLWVVDAREHK